MIDETDYSSAVIDVKFIILIHPNGRGRNSGQLHERIEGIVTLYIMLLDEFGLPACKLLKRLDPKITMCLALTAPPTQRNNERSRVLQGM